MKWYQRLVRYPEIWVLGIAALMTRLWNLGFPSAVVFDEVYFRQFAADYLSGHYFFDIHPPLTKLLLAGSAHILHITPEQLASGDPAATVLRIVPALAGALLVPLVYIILRQLRLGRKVATFGAALVLLDNALLVESRFILTDSMLLLAGMGAFSCYLALRRRHDVWRWAWVVATAACIGVMVSTKWTGLATAGVISLVWLVEGILRRIDWRRLVGEASVVIAVIAAIYIGSFMVHFTLLTKSGEGDAFMSQKYQSTLVGNAAYSEKAHMSNWDKFIELNTVMYTAQGTLSEVIHPYASRWYSWPLEFRPVYFWQGDILKSGTQGHVYLLGNPVVWLLAAIGTLVALIVWLARPEWLGGRRKLVAVLLLGYGLNFVPFAFIDRPMFLYHYLSALLFSIIISSVMIGLVFDWQRKKYGKKVVDQTFWIIVAAVIIGFLYFLPISYGWPLSQADMQQRMWLPSWR